jgi:hypothetical protein
MNFVGFFGEVIRRTPWTLLEGNREIFACPMN